MMNTVMKKIQKAAFGIAFALLTASCSILGIDDGEADSKASVAAQTGKLIPVHITVDEETLTRTAFPAAATRDAMTSFVLTEGETELGRWQKDWDNGITAYKQMQANMVELTEGTHTLTLTGCTASSGTATDGTTYIGTLRNVSVTEGCVLNFTLYFADVSESGTGSLSIRVNWPLNGASRVKTSLYRTEDMVTFASETPLHSTTVSSFSRDGTSYNYLTYTAGSSSRAAGSYLALFEFFADTGCTIPLGSITEPVYITSGKTSSSTVTLDSLNRTFTITYNFNGGSLDGTAQTAAVTQTYSMLQDIVLYGVEGSSKTVAKTGRTFAGWYATEDFSTAPVTGWLKKTTARDITLYAKWLYTVSFDGNGSDEAETEGETASVTALEGSSLTLTRNAFSREGYMFNNWNTLASPTEEAPGTSYEDGSRFTGTVHTTLYAQWLRKAAGTVAVSFIANGGTLVEPVAVTSGERLAEGQLPVTSLRGYRLTGWYTTATFTDESLVDFATFAPAADTTLYAKWAPEVYDITYYDYAEDSDGTPLLDTALSGTHESGYATTHTYDTVTELDTPQRENYGFVGWYTTAEANGEPVTELTRTGYTANITLYARWARNVYHVSASGSDEDYTDDETAYGDGTAGHAFASISKAVSTISAIGYSVDQTIIVHGVLTGIVSISATDLPAAAAKTLTLRGATDNSTDKLNGNAAGTVLTLTTAVPVTISDLTITGGRTTAGYAGGGVTLYNENGKLTLADGARITQNLSDVTSYPNFYAYNGGGGIFVRAGTLIMEDGSEISSNTAANVGGGVDLYSGTFTMNGGSICGNLVSKSGSHTGNLTYYGGGGVYMATATSAFTMNGGEIRANQAPDIHSSYMGGGGIYVLMGSFTMNDGEITENISVRGGGVYMRANNTTQTVVTLHGGTISENTAVTTQNSDSCSGGGMYVDGGTFTMDGGAITRNSAIGRGTSYCTGSGGGITFATTNSNSNKSLVTMSGGSISSNTASSSSGGVSVGSLVTFTMTGGTISGNSAPSDGGGITVGQYGSFVMRGGLISDNRVTSSSGKGGGIYTGNSYNVELYGGRIENNHASQGSAVYWGGPYSNSSNYNFKMGGSACIPAASDGSNVVYLYTGAIMVTSALTAAEPVATIVPSAYTANLQVVKASADVTLSDEAGKFALVPSSDGSPWRIGTNGCLTGPSYTITYHDAGGSAFSGSNEEDLPHSHTYGTATTLVTPERDGYEFLGWYTTSTATGSALTSLAATGYTANITLYAKWASRAVSLEIVNGDISLESDVTDGVVTLTAAGGYSDYQWLIGSSALTSVISGSTVSNGGRTCTFSRENLVTGRAYTIVVSALNANGIEYTATVQVKK